MAKNQVTISEAPRCQHVICLTKLLLEEGKGNWVRPDTLIEMTEACAHHQPHRADCRMNELICAYAKDTGRVIPPNHLVQLVARPTTVRALGRKKRAMRHINACVTMMRYVDPLFLGLVTYLFVLYGQQANPRDPNFRPAPATGVAAAAAPSSGRKKRGRRRQRKKRHSSKLNSPKCAADRDHNWRESCAQRQSDSS